MIQWRIAKPTKESAELWRFSCREPTRIVNIPTFHCYQVSFAVFTLHWPIIREAAKSPQRFATGCPKIASEELQLWRGGGKICCSHVPPSHTFPPLKSTKHHHPKSNRTAYCIQKIYCGWERKLESSVRQLRRLEPPQWNFLSFVHRFLI